MTHTVLKATRFEILRGLTQTLGKPSPSIPLAEKPLRVCTLINEAAFNEDHHLVHNETVFFEDFIHDWNWQDGKFRYYTRISDNSDVVIVYEEERVTPKMNFDPMTGAKLG